MTAPESVDQYLAALPPASRAALENLRRVIRETAPEATEAISYGMPAFRAHGRALVSYAAFRNHCSLFPMSVRVIEEHADEVRPYRTGRGTLQFHPERPIPATLVAAIVRDRLDENAARGRR